MRESKFPLRIAFLTHEPFYPPSGGGSAEAVYLVEEMVRRGHEVHVFCPQIAESESVEEKFRIHLHQFTAWQMGRYARLRNFKYLLYPFFLQRMVARAAGTIKFDLLLSQHAISAVAAGRLKRRLNVPVVMNFPDLLTGFMETWPAYIAPRPLVELLERYEISMPVRYGVDGVLAISDALADCFVERGYPREKILPIYFGYAAEYFPFYVRLIAPNRPPVVVMHGSFDAHHLGRIAFDAIKLVVAKKPETIFRFVGKRTAGLEKFLHRAQTIPHFKFEATGFVPYAKWPDIWPTPAWASCRMRNPPARTARLSPRLSNTSLADCPSSARPSKASGTISKMTRWCAFRNSMALISAKKSSNGWRAAPGLANPRRPIRRAGRSRTRLGAAVPPGG